MTATMTGLVSYVRCFHCGAEMTVIGPAGSPTTEYPGWKIDEWEFYNPHGHHFCPKHQRQAWIAYCATYFANADDDCGPCMGGTAGGYGGIVVDAPFALSNEQVIAELERLKIRCHGHNRITGVDSIEDSHYGDVVADVDVTLG